MHKNATKCNETLSKWCKKQAWSIKNYGHVGDVSDINNMITYARSRYSVSFLKEIIITGYSSLWDQRNSAIFRDI
jgi:hypothetical protein